MTMRELDRNALYERVWTTPMRKLALECGVSDVALAKTCHRLGLPTPTRGYWAQLAAGKAPSRPELPAPTPEQSRFRIAIGPPRQLATPIERPAVRVRRDLRKCHDAVRELGLTLGEAAVDGHGRLVIAGPTSLTFEVTPQHHRRALLILDAVVAASETRGHRARLHVDGAKAGLIVEVKRQEVALSIEEVLDRSEHVLTPKEQENLARGYRHGVPKYDYAPAGRLRLSIVAAHATRSSWADSETRKLDAHLGSVARAA